MLGFEALKRHGLTRLSTVKQDSITDSPCPSVTTHCQRLAMERMQRVCLEPRSKAQHESMLEGVKASVSCPCCSDCIFLMMSTIAWAIILKLSLYI